MSYPLRTTDEMLDEFRKSYFPDRKQLAADYDSLRAELASTREALRLRLIDQEEREKSQRQLEDALRADLASVTATMLSIREQRDQYSAELSACKLELSRWICVWCNHITPATGNPDADYAALQAHVLSCKDSPLVQVKAELAALREAAGKVMDMVEISDHLDWCAWLHNGIDSCDCPYQRMADLRKILGEKP